MVTEVHVDGFEWIVDFIVINIVDDTNPYHTLLRIDWDFDNEVIINIKRRNMIFEPIEFRVMIPLYPMKTYWYVKLVRDGFNVEDLDNI